MEWISVEDRLPKEGIRVLLAYHGGGYQYLYTQGYVLNGEWYCDNRMEELKKSGYISTHWMPLPEPPKV